MATLNNEYQKNNYIRISHKSPIAVKSITKKIISWLPADFKECVVIFIGTDRSTGDALGPLAGSLLERMNPQHLFIYGTLYNPIHAINLQTELEKIGRVHKNAFYIAVDACLGNSSSVGCLLSGTGSIIPGEAFNKSLPPVGDVYLTGVVNVAGFMDYQVLQSTRLSLVNDMALKIALIMYDIDRYISHHSMNSKHLFQ